MSQGPGNGLPAAKCTSVHTGMTAPSAAAVLVVGPAWIGDMVMAQSLFKTLRRSEPALQIDVLAPAWTRTLAVRMAEVREVIHMPLGHGELGLVTRYRLGCRLRSRNYRQAFVLPNSFKSALVPFWARTPRRTGFVGEWRWGLLNDTRTQKPADLPMTVQRFVSLALPPGQPLPEPLPMPSVTVTRQQAADTLSRLALEPAGPVLVLCPGAEYGSAKRWPARHFAELARAKAAEGWAVWVLGSERDVASGAVIAAQAGRACHDLTGRLMLAEAIDLRSCATLVVSNDSGLMHVAAALGRPLVAIYGASDPSRTPPLSAHARVEHLSLPCRPCLRRECPFGHRRCLVELRPERVLSAMEHVLARVPRQTPAVNRPDRRMAAGSG